MRAVEELTTRAKDGLLPYIFLGPWTTAHKLDSTLSRIEAAYGKRALIFDICQPDPNLEAPRPVHDQLTALRNSASGYKNWCEFVAKNPRVIPAVQIGALDQVPNQIAFFRDLDRGMVVRLPKAAFGNASNIAQFFVDAKVPTENVCFILDYERSNKEILAQADGAIEIMQSISAKLPGCFLSLSSSSFPSGFDGKTSQEIFERLFYDIVVKAGKVAPIIYSDRGSARVESQGGGGQPLPRVDYAAPVEWSFFRVAQAVENDPSTRPPAYRKAANQAMESKAWDAKLRVWGSQMIERTAAGDPDAIISPMRCTAVRINIHLHRQLFYDDPKQQYDTDDDWTD